jgi:hypothetical protein
LAAVVREATGRLEPFDSIGTGQVQAERVASARRIRDENGRMITRWSGGAKDPKMAQAPEGPIDPWLKSITLARGDKPLVATFSPLHPQTFCCDGGPGDFVGGALPKIIEKCGFSNLLHRLFGATSGWQAAQPCQAELTGASAAS